MLPPASISACVTVWLAVYAQVSPTSRRLSLSPVVSATRVRLLMNGSLTVTPVSVWLPVFWTTNGVADHFARHVGAATRDGRVLGDVQRRVLNHRNRRVVGIRPGLVGVGRRRVDDRNARVNLCLRDGMAGGVRPGLANFKEVVVVAGRVGNPREVADERVAHRHAGQRLVAGVLDTNGVADHFACDVSRVARNAGVLDDVERRASGSPGSTRRRCPDRSRWSRPSPC
jgi:hypothetical protein